VDTKNALLKVQSTLMVMVMFMMVMGLMVMVMIGCSNGYGSITPTNTPILMVPTETPAPTVTISPTHAPTPVPLSYDQAQEQIVDALINFNKIHNDFLMFMASAAYFQEHGLIVPEASVELVIPALDVYANALTSWRQTEFKDSNWLNVNHSLNNMREAELEKTSLYKVFSQQLRNVYREGNDDQLRIILQRMVEFSESDTAIRPALLQYQLLKELSISPDEVNFHYADLFEDELESITEPPLIDNMLNEKSS